MSAPATGRLSGKIAIVTGAGSGIGRASALLFASEGAKLVLFDRTEEVHRTAAAVEQAGGHAIAMVGDAGEEGGAERVAARVIEIAGCG